MKPTDAERRYRAELEFQLVTFDQLECHGCPWEDYMDDAECDEEAHDSDCPVYVAWRIRRVLKGGSP